MANQLRRQMFPGLGKFRCRPAHKCLMADKSLIVLRRSRITDASSWSSRIEQVPPSKGG